MCWGDPPLCHFCAPLVRASGWGFPSPFPLSMAACVKRGLLFGGAPCRRPPLGPPRAVRTLGAPFQVRWPPSLGVPAPVLSGVPPLALAAKRGCAPLGGGAPFPFHPSLAARIKRSRPFGGGLSINTLSAVRPVALFLLGVLSPPSVRRAVLSPPLRPLALGACGRSGGALSAIASSAVLPVTPSLLGVLSPPAVCCIDHDDGAGLALPRAPSDMA